MITKAISEKQSDLGIPSLTKTALLISSLTLLAPLAAVASVQLAWDAVDDDRVGLYQLWYGTSSGTYDTHVDSTTTTATVDQVTRDTNYYFVVRACTADASQCGAYSNELQYIDENDTPVASNDSATIAEDSAAITINVLANDSDGDGDALTVSSASASTGTVSINQNGTLSYAAPANFFGSDTISYTVVDGYSGSDSAVVAVTVTGSNDAPSAVDDTLTVAEDSSNTSVSVLANDSDIDGDSMTVSGASATTGTVSVAANGTLRYTPPENFFGSDTIAYTISDGNGGSDSASVAVTVTTVNDLPVATDDTATVAEGSSGNTIGVLSNDSDLDGDTLSVSEASASNGSVSVNQDGTLSYSPQASLVGSDTITYVISDGNGGSDTASVNVTVTAVALPIPTGLQITFTN